MGIKDLARLVLVTIVYVSCVKEPQTISVTGVTLNNTNLSMTEGETANLVATVSPKDADNQTVIWSSSDGSVASVNSNGRVSALKAGNATISVKTDDGGFTASCAVKVESAYVAVSSITLSKSELSLVEGESETITATVLPENATDKTIVWSSSDPSVATVGGGKITAVKEGEAAITAKAGDKTSTCRVTIEKKVIAVESIELDKSEIELTEGESVTLSATITPEDATDNSITWTSSENSIATVDQNGKVTAIKEGTATITAKAGGKQAFCEITVIKKVIQVTSISLDKEEMTLFVGNQAVLTATVTPDNATDKTVTWTSSNTSAATVENGLIKGVGTGRSIITATAGNQTASCSILVVKDSSDGVYAMYNGGAMSIIDGLIQYGSQLYFGVTNYSSEIIKVVSVQLIDGVTGSEGNVMSIGTVIEQGGSSSWSIRIGLAGIHSPIARFVYTFKGKEYTCEAKYKERSW